MILGIASTKLVPNAYTQMLWDVTPLHMILQDFLVSAWTDKYLKVDGEIFFLYFHETSRRPGWFAGYTSMGIFRLTFG